MTQAATLALQLDTEQTAKLRALYRHLHAHPELSMQEFATATLIEEQLDGLGIEHFRCGDTGLVGILRNGEGPVVAFRADSDGLPIEEATGLAYASTDTGTLPDGTAVPFMHGCGHDTHVASLLGAAEVLTGNRGAWSGTLVLIFQPGEETAAGALAVLDDGLWDRAPRPEVVFGQHIMRWASRRTSFPPRPSSRLTSAPSKRTSGGMSWPPCAASSRRKPPRPRRRSRRSRKCTASRNALTIPTLFLQSSTHCAVRWGQGQWKSLRP